MKLRYDVINFDGCYNLMEVFIDGYFQKEKRTIKTFDNEEDALKAKDKLDMAKSMLEVLSRNVETLETQKQIYNEISNYTQRVAK